MPLNPRIRDWQGKRVWVVGASTGIGLAFAQAIAAQGARVAMSARNAERLGGAGRTVPGSILLPMDATRAEDWAAARDELIWHFGGLDVLVLNAGTYMPQRAFDFGMQQVRGVFETNVLGVYEGLAACLPRMLAQDGGHVVIVASVAGYGGLPRALAYGPSKAALINLAESLWLDLAPRGIGVSLVNPGFVATPLTAQNDFHMPALITPERAARYMLEGLAAGHFEIHFPRRFSLLLKLLNYLPYGVYLRLVRRTA